MDKRAPVSLFLWSATEKTGMQLYSYKIDQVYKQRSKLQGYSSNYVRRAISSNRKKFGRRREFLNFIFLTWVPFLELNSLNFFLNVYQKKDNIYF